MLSANDLAEVPTPSNIVPCYQTSPTTMLNLSSLALCLLMFQAVSGLVINELLTNPPTDPVSDPPSDAPSSLPSAIVATLNVGDVCETSAQCIGTNVICSAVCRRKFAVQDRFEDSLKLAFDEDEPNSLINRRRGVTRHLKGSRPGL